MHKFCSGNKNADIRMRDGQTDIRGDANTRRAGDKNGLVDHYNGLLIRYNGLVVN